MVSTLRSYDAYTSFIYLKMEGICRKCRCYLGATGISP